MSRRKPVILPVPPLVRDLRGMRFDRLVVRYFAGYGPAEKMSAESTGNRKTYWCCVCDCGTTCRVAGRELTRRSAKSCGCLRADPGVRKAARRNVPRERRVEICNAARKNVRTRTKAYSLTMEEAAERIGGDVDQVEILIADNVLTGKHGRVSVSSVKRLLKVQARNRKHCKITERVDLDLHARNIAEAEKTPRKRKSK